jgi:hypothetical protein
MKPRFLAHAVYSDPWIGCISFGVYVDGISSSHLIHLFRVPMMGLDFVLVVLAGYKSLQHYFRVPDKTWSGARLMRTFARDSVLYFLW